MSWRTASAQQHVRHLNNGADCIAISSRIDTAIIQKLANLNIPFFAVPHEIFLRYLEGVLNGHPSKKYQTTKAGVERSICTSVEFSWDRSQDTIKYALQCPFIDSRPTNSEFLALMKA